MKLSNGRTYRLLLTSTALVAAGFASTASAQSTIDEAGVISVAAGLEGFIAATSQLGDAADFVADVTGAGQTIALTGPTITEDQTVTGNSVLAETRLNQTTANVLVAATESGGTFTGATLITADPAATVPPAPANPSVSISAGIGIVSQQRVTGSSDITADVGTTGARADNSITLTSPDVSGELVVGANRTVADALANDAQNTISATAGVTGTINVPIAIASLQTFTAADGDGVALGNGGTEVSASAFGDFAVTLDGANIALSGDVRLDDNVLGARAGVNTAVNDLFAGDQNGGGTAQGGVGGTRLSASALDTSGAIGTFNADFAVASLQVIGTGENPFDPADPEDTFANIAATAVGDVALTLLPATVVTSDTLTARGNTILSEAAGNDATNRAVITTDGLSAVSVGVASAQEITGNPALAAGTFDVSASTTGDILMEGPLAVAGGELAGVAVDMSGNRIGAEANANRALNVAAVTSTGSLDSASGTVAGRQTATDVNVGAVVTSGNVTANFAEIAGAGASVALNANEVSAVAALNTQTNVLQNSGSSLFGASSMASTSRQEIDGGGVVAEVRSATISLTAGGATDTVATVANNTVLASATGNVSTTTITNRSGSFSFTR